MSRGDVKDMKIDLIAELKTTKDFMEAYKNGDEKKVYEGKSLIFFSLANTNLSSRYEISNFLMEHNVDLQSESDKHETVLHVLLGQSQHDVHKTCELCKWFIEKGVDINAKDRMGQTAIQYITRMNKSDDELIKLYDVWFAEPNLNLETKDNMGYSPLEYAEQFPYRVALVERMKKYERR